jgi:hypothetical protein
MVGEQETVRAEVDRLLHSKTFEGSEVHRRLLQYLAEKTLSGEADRLKEYTIGLEAFSKPPEYDPRRDSIVRLQIGRLRQKLSAYYETEANGTPGIMIRLPKGAFKLEFGPRHPHEPPEPARRTRWRKIPSWGRSVAGLLCLAWALAATFGYIHERRAGAIAASRWSPELETLWQPFLQSNRSLVVCLGTPLFVRFPNLGFFRDPRTNDWAEAESSTRLQALRHALGDPDIHAAYSFTGAGEASAAFLFAELLSSRKRDMLLTRSNLLSWQQVTAHDLIFIGPPKFNPQLQAAALAGDIVMESDGIRNLKPRAGEPVFLQDHILPGKISEGETHALISRLPGLEGRGVVLRIEGNANPDTLAAAQWLTRAERARELIARLKRPSGEVPRYFQAVLRVVFKQGIPVESSYVFHHAVAEGPRR